MIVCRRRLILELLHEKKISELRFFIKSHFLYKNKLEIIKQALCIQFMNIAAMSGCFQILFIFVSLIEWLFKSVKVKWCVICITNIASLFCFIIFVISIIIASDSAQSSCTNEADPPDSSSLFKIT